MQYNVAGLLKAPIGERREAELDAELDLHEPTVSVVGPVRGWVRLTRDHAGIMVEADLAARLVQECSRCLAPVEDEVNVELVEHFWPTVYIPGGPPAGQTPEDEDRSPETAIDVHHVLDLTEVVRQVLVLAVPSHPLCRADCKGLCPQCGNDLNNGPCECASDIDPRWAGLKELLDRA